MRTLLFCGLGLLASGFFSVTSGQDVPAKEVPLIPTDGMKSSPPSAVLMERQAARRALELGFPSVAIGIYKSQLAALPANTPASDRNRLLTELATALLDDGKASEAMEALENYSGARTAAVRLRKSMADVQSGRIDAARGEIPQIKPEELNPGDLGWYFFVQGQIAERSNDMVKAKALFNRAMESANSDLHRARFRLARDELRLVSGEFSEKELAASRALLEHNVGRTTGYQLASQIAVELNGLQRKAEAVEFLRKQIQALPVEERLASDELYLLLGLIAGANDTVGRNALVHLLDSASDREKQRVALLRLKQGAAKSVFRAELDRLIKSTPPHPILEELLLFRAEERLADKAFIEAEADAVSMLEAFPGSRLRPQALGIRARTAWERSMYLTAATSATEARNALDQSQGSEARAELGVLVAEAYFRAKKYRSAADAYAVTLAAVPAGVLAGELIFQRVISEIEAGLQDAAISEGKGWWSKTSELLDEMALDPRFDVMNRWQAEWNFSRALLGWSGGTKDGKGTEAIKMAFDRVERLLNGKSGISGNAGDIPKDLRVRMAWLQARLALAIGKAEQSLEIIDKLLGSLEGIEPKLRMEVAGRARLVQADAHFSLKHEEQGLEILRKLRADFPESDAAVSSYFVEANRAAELNRYADAQLLLVNLADKFPKHPYAPLALYQAALNAERRGQDSSYVDANKLVDRLADNYPQSDLVFYARFKQGELFRQLFNFPLAQRAYDSVIQNFQQHPDILFAYLGLAATHNAQASESSSPGQLSDHAEQALAIYERLVDRQDAPTDLRIEAGYNLGLLLSRRPQPENRIRAQKVWWEQVINPFLLDPKAKRLEGRAPYWMSRTLVSLGELLETETKLEQAREAYSYLLTKNLPYAEIARTKLARFGVSNLK